MYIGFSKKLKALAGLRLGFGVRIAKNNWWYIWFLMIFILFLYIAWYMFIAVLWLLYFLLYLIVSFFKCMLRKKSEHNSNDNYSD